jgi:alkaline phosphatase D
MLDTRNYDRSITTLNWNDDYVAELKDDAGRSLMGSRQEHWFYNSLSESQKRGATWRVIGNQIIFSSVNQTTLYGGDGINADQWDVSIFMSY